MKYCLLRLLCLLLLILFYPSSVSAFVDDFNDELSLDNYVISTNSGAVYIDSGKLILTAPSNSKHFPYVALKSQHIGLQASSVLVEFRYSSVGLFGAGIVLDNTYPTNSQYYDVGSNSIAWTWNWGSPPKLRLGMFPFNYTDITDQTEKHTLLVKGAPGLYEVYLDNLLLGSTYSTKSISSLWFGNPQLVNTTSSWPVIEIDRIVIDELDPLPYYSQKNPEWKDVVYDSATDWAGAGLDTIERWGCAITSVAMVLDQYDINMPNGDVADPDKLNIWLKDQPDGYVGGGLLNWLAISRLARQARVAGQAETDLEFVKSTGSPADELEAGLYPIINEGGHFVTLYDQDTDNYTLNDPKDESRTTKPKTDPIVSVNTYTPSDTDLSYILVVLNEQTEIEASFAGNNIGDLYTENLVDDVGGAMSPSTKLVYIPQPLDGNYRLNLNNPLPDPQKIKIYAYDTQGSVAVLDQAVATGTSSWELTYTDNGTAPVLSLLDTLPPKYVGTTTFEGWYSAPQTAVFGFEDDNLSPDFVPPSCVIGNEGPKQTCTVTTTICDMLDNCTELTLTSNPANIDLTPPPKTRKIWGVGLFPRSYLHWLPTWDTVKYRVEWGLTQNSLTNTATTKHPYLWVATPRTNRIFARVISIDRAGNESEPSATTVLPVWWGWWRFY